MRSVVIVVLDPTSDTAPRFSQAPILRRPNFLFLQAAMEPFDVAVALRVMIGRAPMRDTQPSQDFQESERSELRPVVIGQRYASLATASDSRSSKALLHRCQGVFGSATVRPIPAHDLPRATIDHAH
jgi:hypothetical protein